MGLNEFLFLLTGLKWTVLLSAIGFIFGGIAGLGIALARTAKWKWLQKAAAGYIAVFQGTPLLMQLFVVFYGLVFLDIKLDAWRRSPSASRSMRVPISVRSGAVRLRPCRRARPKPPMRSASTMSRA